MKASWNGTRGDRRAWLLAALVLGGCAMQDGERRVAAVEAGEELPGGDTTNRLLFGSHSFDQHAANLSEENQGRFFTGNSFFNQTWVQAPASTESRDGLGPTFNARSCSGCHFKDGRGAPPDDDPEALGLLLRLSVPGEGEHGAALADAIYGGQLQDAAIDGVEAEGAIAIELATIEGSYEDGEAYELREPSYSIDAPAFGALPAELRISPRVAPQMIGLGLLEAIPEERLTALADPDDGDHDGLSGRINRVWDADRQAMTVGRFGWKAEQPTVLQQAAGAFLGDMGISSRLFPQQECPSAQSTCVAAVTGGDPEIADDLLDKVALYARALAPPERREHASHEVLRGKSLFADCGCDSCHVPSHRTGEGAIDELSSQLVWPYTDLLLHDLGEGLSDERPSFDAEGSEWRTPPLWGIGLIPEVNGHQRLLHDGRARNVPEAILWHGGEAETAAAAFAALPAEDRAALVRFVESLRREALR